MMGDDERGGVEFGSAKLVINEIILLHCSASST